METSLRPDKNTIKNLATLKKIWTRKEKNFAAGDGAEVIAEEARRIVPVKTGRLKRNIVARQNKRRGRANAYVGVNYKRGSDNARYAHIVEYGSRAGATARPFIRPAAQRKGAAAAKIIEDSLQKQALKRLK